MRTFRFFDNTGGMNLRANDLTLDDNEAELIINLHATTRGSWSSSNVGYVNLNVTPLADGAEVSSLYDYHTLTGLSHIVATAGTSLYTFLPETGVATLLSDTLTLDQRMHFVTFQGLLIGCNGVDTPITWDGSNPVAALAGWPPTIPGVTPGMPSIAEIFANRVIFSGDASNPSMLYISELENVENFTPSTGATSAGAIQVSPGDGEKITALKTLFLPLINEEVLVIFKERSTYILSGDDPDSFALQKISDEFGAVSARSVILVGNELMFLSSEGVTSLSTATNQGNLTTGFLSNAIRPQIDSLNRNELVNSFAIHLRDRQEIWWCVADGSESRNQTVLVYNYGIKRAWSKRIGIEAACGLYRDGRLYTGNYEGIVQQQLRGNTYNGEAIPWTYRTGFLDFSEPRRRKRIKDIELFFKQIATLQVTVYMYWDFRRAAHNRQSRLLSVTPDSASSVFGTALFGQDYYNLSGSSTLRFAPNGSGQRFQLELTGEDVGKAVEIEGWSITTISGGYR